MLMLSSGSIWTATRNVILSPSGLPGVDDVAWPATGRKKHHVDTPILVRAGVTMTDRFSRRRDTAQAVAVDGRIEPFPTRAPFHLDEGNRPSAANDQIDLATRRLQSPRKHAPTVQSKPERRPAFAAAPLTFSNLPVHSPRNSMARA